MNDLIKAAPSETMSSIDLLGLINDYRSQHGESNIRANDFHARVADELEGDYYESFVVQNPNKTTTTMFYLTIDQCTLVAMRESKGVRRNVLERLKMLQPKPPAQLTTLEILQIAMQAEQGRLQAIAERDHAIATKAQIGSKREATAMATASQAVRQANALQAELGRCKDHATIIAVQNITGEPYKWQALKKWCKDRGVKPIEVIDPRWGIVKSWPAQAWADVYGVDLSLAFVRADR